MLSGYSLLNLFLRGLTIASKFFLMFVVGKLFSLDQLGVYAIFLSTVTLSTFILGFDFYTFSNRELLSENTEQQKTIVRNQFLFYFFTYIIFLPPLVLVFHYEILPYKYLFFFYSILIFEHLAQEYYRIFITLSFTATANFLLFIRSGVWVVGLIIYWLLIDKNNFEVIWWAWLIGSFLSLIISFIVMQYKLAGFRVEPVDWNWIIKGVKICLWFLGATIAYKVIEFANRYVLDVWMDKKSVGIYVFYNQIANIMNVIIDTSIISIMYPKLMTAYYKKDLIGFQAVEKKIKNNILIVCISLFVVLSIMIFPILRFMNKTDFYNELPSFYLILIANIFFNISLVYHFVLYAIKEDKSLFYTTLLSMFVNVVACYFFVTSMGILGAAMSSLVSYLFLFIVKYNFAKNKKIKLNFK